MILGAGVLLVAVLPFSSAFTFNTSTPTQCGELTVSWSGGTAPYYLLLVPTEQVNHGQIMNVSIPSSASGSYSFTLAQPADLQFLATMYDATGFGSGGTTSVLQVGSGSDSSCLNNNVQSDFTFSITPETNPSQCGSLSVSWASQQIGYPLSLYGLIPHGTAFSLPISQSGGDTSYDWTVDIASGTQFLLLMSDSGTYGTGGSTSLLTVQSGDSSCLNSTSPSSVTSSATSSAQTSQSSSSGSAVAGVGGSSGGGSDRGGNGKHKGSSSSASGTNVGAIAGGVVGGVLGFALLALLAFFCLRRRRQTRRDSAATPAVRSYGVDGDAAPVEKHRGSFDILGGLLSRRRGSVDSDPGSGTRPPLDVEHEQYQATPFMYHTPPDTPPSPQRATNPSNPHSGTETLASSPRTPGGGAAGLGLAGRSSGETSRPSGTETGTGTGTGTASHFGAGIGTGTETAADSSLYSSNMATMGHVQRHNSTYKHRPGAPSNGSTAMTAPQARTEDRDGTVPDTPQERPSTILQHADAGSVEELPPRYDQLRARNPDMN